MKKLLSVITICKNEPFIEETCKSVCAQANQNFEWLIIDGASTDNTLETLAKYKDRADVFISEPDNGTYHAMNKGIKRACGEYLLFMNGGDTFYDDKTTQKVLPFLNQGLADVFYGDSYRLFEKKEDCFIKTYPDKLEKMFF